jgi:hypothetical protein
MRRNVPIAFIKKRQDTRGHEMAMRRMGTTVRGRVERLNVKGIVSRKFDMLLFVLLD